MVITYRRAGGPLTIVAVAAGIVAIAMLTVTLAAVAIVAVLVMAPVVWLARAVGRRWWRRAAVPPAAPWPHRTIDVAAVDDTTTSSARHRSV